MPRFNHPLDALRYHTTGAIERGEKQAIVERRPLSVIAREISKTWTKPYFGAVPYLSAMHSLDTITDEYGADSAKSIVLYFLSNAATWRGEDARRIKAELKQIAGVK